MKPPVIKSYNGGDITFPDNPYLAIDQGHKKIALCDTLLRAEYTVSFVMIMAAAKELICNADVPQGPICIALIPEEEIG